MRILIFQTLVITFLISACTPSKVPIQYGSDVCAFCKMTVVDKKHAAEIVTQKGRAYIFDAIECMVDYIDNKPDDYLHYLVSDYQQEILIDASQSYFLISKNIPSPMGAYLSAYEDKSEAIRIQKLKEGKIFDWSGMRAVRKK